MSKTLNKHITLLDYARTGLLTLSGTDSAVSLFAFTITISTPFGITDGISLTFIVTNKISKILLKTLEKNKRELIIKLT